jgi:hypothetical protein
VLCSNTPHILVFRVIEYPRHTPLFPRKIHFFLIFTTPYESLTCYLKPCTSVSICQLVKSHRPI